MYTNIEVYINSLVNHLTAVQNGTLDVYVNPQNFVEKYNAAEDGSKFIMASGTYTTSTVLAVKNHKYTFVPDENAKPVFAGSFSSENAEIFSGSLSFTGIDFDLTNTYSNLLQFKNGAGVSILEIKNASIKGIKQSLLVAEGASDHPISKIVLENCIVDGSATESASFIQPDSHILNSISIKNSTVFNYKKGNSFINLQKKDALSETVNITIENNTIYNSGSQDGFVFINNQYGSASTFTFRNNIMQEERENPKPIFMFNSNHASGAGKLILDNNLLEVVASQVVKGAISVTETNAKTLTGLEMTVLSYPNPVQGDFSFSKNSPLAKASLEGGVLGDPRWLKANATFSQINYVNAIDAKPIVISPTEYMEGAITNLPTPKLEGYTFFGWSASAATPGLIKSIASDAKGSQTFYAFWGEGGNNKPDPKPAVKSAVSYINSLDGKAITGLNPVEYTEGTALTLPVATLKDYTFFGWSVSETRPNSIKEITVTATGNQTFYAFFGVDGNNKKDEVIPPTFYTLSFVNLPGGAINPNLTSVQTGTNYSLKEAQCPGYRFLGWYADALYGKEVTAFGTTQKDNFTLYGRWKKLGDFYVFPTITSGTVTLKSSIDNDRVLFFSMNGLLIKQMDISGLETEISTLDLASGSYIIKSLKTGLSARIIVK